MELAHTHAQSLQSCSTLCEPMDHSLPGSSVHGILLARILSGLPCPPPGELPYAGIEPVSFNNQGNLIGPTEELLILKL